MRTAYWKHPWERLCTHSPQPSKYDALDAFLPHGFLSLVQLGSWAMNYEHTEPSRIAHQLTRDVDVRKFEDHSASRTHGPCLLLSAPQQCKHGFSSVARLPRLSGLSDAFDFRHLSDWRCAVERIGKVPLGLGSCDLDLVFPLQ